jgi:ileal sodium/bile acid cotransporter, putative
MCPVLLTFIFSSGLLLLEMINAFTVSYGSKKVLLEEGKTQVVNYTIVDTQKKGQENQFYSIKIGDLKIAEVANQSDIQITPSQRSYLNESHFYYSSNFTLLGLTIGHSELYINPVGDNKSIENPTSTQPESDKLIRKEDANNRLNIIVTIEKTSLQSIFTVSMVILVSLNYINLGCAMDLEIVQSVLKKPIAPAVGFVSQYVFMPLVS